MRKILAVALAVVAVLAMALTANAATGLNANETEILAILNEVVKSNAGTSFTIPEKYVKAAENYFKSDYEMTDTEKTEIAAILRDAQVIVKNEMDRIDKTSDNSVSKKTVFQFKDMKYSEKKAVLEHGQEAAAKAGLVLVYEVKTNNVVITKPADETVAGSKATVLFENAPLIKTTGETVNTAALCAAVIALAVVGSAAVLFVVAKKKGLLVK